MPKIPDSKLIQINKLLNRANKAINNLERTAGNKKIYPELKKDLQDMYEELNNQYALDEYDDPEARNAALEDMKKESRQ